MDTQLTAAHWVYLAGIVVILITMALRKNIVVPAVLATLLTAWVFSGSIVTGLSSIFNASLVAAQELFNIFLIIAFITAMLGALREMGADKLMVAPFRRVMRAGTSSFITLAVVTYVISLFFWPTPAVPLVGAVLIPVAIRAGLSPLSVGMVIAIAGQGMALSSDYIIKVAPGISATAAGVDADSVADKALVLSLITGIVALVITYVMQRRTWQKPSADLLVAWENKADKFGVPEDGKNDGSGSTPAAPEGGTPAPVGSGGTPATTTATTTATATATAILTPTATVTEPVLPKSVAAKTFAALVPAAYFAFIIYLLLGKFTSLVPPLQGGDAAGIVGGIAAILLFAACVTNDRRDFLESSSTHIIDGLVFAFKAMGVVLPIAGFFFIGSGDFSARVLGMGSDATGPAFLFDLISSAMAHVTPSPFVLGFGVLLVGIVAGLDGSGFSGLPLTGSLAGALGPAAGMDPATLAAIGQMSNIWSGGGTLVAWSSLIAVAGFARVPVLMLARKCFVPVMSGLILSTVFAILVF
ncbi:membrane protein [soil metagenome]